MAKQFRPEMGYPVGEFLGDFANQVEEGDPLVVRNLNKTGRKAGEIYSMIEKVQHSTNLGACMRESQGQALVNSLFLDSRDSDEIVQDLIVRVNGFRLDCKKCLNPNCEHRDPDTAFSLS